MQAGFGLGEMQCWNPTATELAAGWQAWAYAVLVLFEPPYTWTITGIAIGLALAWAGVGARRARIVAGCDESA